jgi:hypothetical protein
MLEMTSQPPPQDQPVERGFSYESLHYHQLGGQ